MKIDLIGVNADYLDAPERIYRGWDVVRYLTGFTALNIPQDGFQPDWHQVDLLRTKNFKIANENYRIADDVFELGTELFDCSEWCDRHNLPKIVPRSSATHLRACVDIIHNSISQNRIPTHFTIDDLDFNPDTIARLPAALDKLKKQYSVGQKNILSQWISQFY